MKRVSKHTVIRQKFVKGRAAGAAEGGANVHTCTTQLMAKANLASRIAPGLYDTAMI